MDEALAGAALGAASNVAGSLINSNMVAQTNAADRQFDSQMMNQQHQWALQNFNMTNAYNTPAAQMQRFKAAGLNPNLIYGQGSPGNATTPQLPSAPNYNFQAPQPGNAMMGLGNAVGGFLDLKQKQMNIENTQLENANKALDGSYLAQTMSDRVRGQKSSADIAYYDTAFHNYQSLAAQQDYEHQGVMYPLQEQAANFDPLVAAYRAKAAQYLAPQAEAQVGLTNFQKALTGAQASMAEQGILQGDDWLDHAIGYGAKLFGFSPWKRN